MEKTIRIIIIALALIWAVFGLTAYTTSDFTEEEHIERIKERITKRFITKETVYTSFDVYPLFNEKDEFKYALVEFEPYGFLYVKLRDEQLKSISCLGASTSMYMLSNLSGNATWSPFTFDESYGQPYPDIDKCWILDEDGETIIYDRSPYFIGNAENERRYLFVIDDSGYIPAVKRDGVFINLISQEHFTIVDGHLSKKQAYAFILFVGKVEFDL